MHILSHNCQSGTSARRAGEGAFPFRSTPVACLLAALFSPFCMAAQMPVGASALSGQMQRTAPTPGLVMPDLPALPGIPGGVVFPEGSTRVTLQYIATEGVPTRLSAASRRLLAEYTGRPLSFADLQMMTQRLTAFYRHNGLVLARVILPPQTIKNGSLTIRVLPGVVDDVTLHNQAPVRDAFLNSLAADTLPDGSVVTRSGLERLSLLVNEIPGVRGQLDLKTGSQPGTTSLTLETRQQKRAGGYVGVDNQSSPVTGRYRLTGGGYVNGLLGTGDQLRADLFAGYDHAGLLCGRIDYSQLISGYGTRAGVAVQRMDYRYHFSGMKFDGYSDGWESYILHPLVRSSRAQVNVRGSVSQSFLEDRYPEALSAAGDVGRKRATSGTLGVAGSAATVPGGVSGGALDFTLGRMDYRNYAAKFWSGSDLSNSGGAFFVTGWQLNHEQQLPHGFSVFTRGIGQFTNKNLDSSRKFYIGGPSAVRAYDVGAGAVDDGAVVTGELRWHHSLPSTAWGGASPQFTGGLFWDYGTGRQNHNNSVSGNLLSADNQVQLSGGGVYAGFVSGSYNVTATVARRATGADPVTGVKDDYRVWLSAVRTF